MHISIGYLADVVFGGAGQERHAGTAYPVAVVTKQVSSTSRRRTNSSDPDFPRLARKGSGGAPVPGLDPRAQNLCRPTAFRLGRSGVCVAGTAAYQGIVIDRWIKAGGSSLGRGRSHGVRRAWQEGPERILRPPVCHRRGPSGDGPFGLLQLRKGCSLLGPRLGDHARTHACLLCREKSP